MVIVKGLEQEMIFLFLVMTSGIVLAGKHWANRQDGHLHNNFVDDGPPQSHINRLDVVCSKNHMTVHMFFDSPFYGMVFSHGGPQHERCVHVGPRAGLKEVSFDIRYDRCGTVEDLSGQFHENTIVIQYGEDILEAWDEAKRLRCEWLESFEKQSSKPTLSISDIDTVELNFQGDDIDCWMEVQSGKGPWAHPVSGIIPIGSPLTLVIAINDNSREFDMRVKKCSAEDGSGSVIQLTDINGCVLRPSLLTPFTKIRDFGGKATLVAFSHLFAFKFPDTLDVFVHCIVEVCRHGCPDSCGKSLLTEHHPHPREHLFPLASKKEQKLVEFSKSNTTTLHKVQATHHRKRPQYLTQVPVSLLKQSLAESEKKKQSTAFSGREIYQQLLKNSSTASSFIDKHLQLEDLKLNALTNRHNIGEAGAQRLASTNHKIVEDTRKQIKPEVILNSVPNVISEVKPIPIGNYHKIIGHHAYWDSEEIRLQNDQYIKHHIPPVKKFPDKSHKALTADVFNSGSYVLKEVPINEQAAQPEPASWSANDVKPLTKAEVIRTHISHKHNQHLQDETLRKQLDRFVVIKENPNDKAVYQNFPHPIELEAQPEPEPESWTFEQVKPLQRPEVLSALPQAAPEPAPWTFDSVKPLTKQDFKTHSLNHKHSTEFDLLNINAPFYKESVQPLFSVPEPAPVYIPKPTPSSQNMSGMGMMNMMMMMMPTMLPFTYQTARFPQKSTARNIRPNSQNFPYPVPQFPNKHLAMLNVIADRRMDGDMEDSNLELQHESIQNTNPSPSEAESATNPKLPNDSNVMKEKSEVKSSVLRTMEQNIDSSDAFVNLENEKLLSKSNQINSTRPPIVDFVPPALDANGFNTEPSSKDRSAHYPRALNRRKRSSEPEFGVRQRFQAIALSDLAFDLNLTSDSTSIFKGRREEIVYGICMSPASMSFGVGFILILTLCSLITSVVLYEHSSKLRNKTSHLSVLSRTFNGRLESLYRVSRKQPNSSCREIG